MNYRAPTIVSKARIVEAWAKCKSAKNVVTFKFPFFGRYGLVRKEYEYEDPC
jgi:hypothetical protein